MWIVHVWTGPRCPLCGCPEASKIPSRMTGRPLSHTHPSPHVIAAAPPPAQPQAGGGMMSGIGGMLVSGDRWDVWGTWCLASVRLLVRDSLLNDANLSSHRETAPNDPPQ